MSEDLKKLLESMKNKKERYMRFLERTHEMVAGLPNNLDTFLARCESLPRIYSQFSTIMEEFNDIGIANPDLKINTLSELYKFDELYFEVIGAKQKHSAPVVPVQNGSAAQVEGSHPTVQSKWILPDLNIPKFSGNVEQFSSFSALYDANVHLAPGFNDAQRFSYLVSYLEGEPLRLVNTIQFGAENYLAAYNKLKKHYTQPRMLAQHYMNKIFGLKPPKSGTIDSIGKVIDTLDSSVTSLKSLNLPDLGDFILLNVGLRLVDNGLRSKFESKSLDGGFPRFADLIKFMRDQCLVAKLVDNPSSSSSSNSTSSGQPKPRNSWPAKNNSLIATDQVDGEDVDKPLPKKPQLCPCSPPVSHPKMATCPGFVSANLAGRNELVKRFRLCWGCLSRSHAVSNCTSKSSCTTCGSTKHHSLLHRPSGSLETSPTGSAVAPALVNQANSSVVLASCGTSRVSSDCLLGTIRVRIMGADKQWHIGRAVCDPGSTVNFATTAMANVLGLKRSKCPFDVSGVGNSPPLSVQGMVQSQVAPHFGSEPVLNMNFAVVSKITSDLPAHQLHGDYVQRFRSLQLADPEFDKPSPIDLLFGIQVFLDIISVNPAQIQGTPSAMLTSFGWIVWGTLPDESPRSLPSLLVSPCDPPQDPPLDRVLRSFWEREEVSFPIPPSPEDAYCEDYFTRTVSRDPASGRYIVRLPFADGARPSLGSTRQLAQIRLTKLEHRFAKDPNFERLYKENLMDYVNQGHLVPARDSSPYIMTHHGVLKRTEKGDKIRVVFSPVERDASGRSLNDALLTGPKLQNDIGMVVTRFRLHRVPLTCDIRQCYREIGLHEADRKYQRILFRFSPQDPVQEWELTRVTFGVKSAPYLCIRTLHQLVADEGGCFPRAAEIVLEQAYVDDLLCGAASIGEAISLRSELIALLQRGGFELDKWASSDPGVFAGAETSHRDLGEPSASVKVLGLWWDPAADCFCYKFSKTDGPPTKKGVLSRIARVFDTNGYLGPVIFAMKALMQSLWLDRVGWDECLDGRDVGVRWATILEELPLLESLSIPRFILDDSWVTLQLIGFSDASDKGMAAVLYLRAETPHGIICNMIRSKSRVAPLKTWTIPRLELGAAVLLSELVKSTIPLSSGCPVNQIFCFTDSSCTLAWVNTPPYKLKIFVSNRVVQITDNCPSAIWRFIPGVENPADSASRGLLPSPFMEDRLWWHGPSFLLNPIATWPQHAAKAVPSDELELKSVETSLVTSSPDDKRDTNPFVRLTKRCSSYLKAVRCTIYAIRFLFNLRMKCLKQPKSSWLMGPMSRDEFWEARHLLVESTQQAYYQPVFKAIQKNEPLPKPVQPLTPFVDSLGYLRVGGRLEHAPIPYGMKHPLLVPRESPLATLLCDHYHYFSGHGGPRLASSLLNREYWISPLRSLMRARIFQCGRCAKFQGKPLQPIMANLPPSRVRPGRVFLEVGCDVAGPFMIKLSLQRNARSQKAYFTVFVCMATKAIHIEFLTSLSTEAFLACFDRFIARRGLPIRMFSDQGSNFRGAAREMGEVASFLKASNPGIMQYLGQQEIEWIFLPPYAPNFGGLWERGVRSIKFHLARVIGDQTLNLEEFITILVKIESILNSRPLNDVSVAPQDDFDVLTPGHFLIQAPLLARPDRDLLDLPQNRLDHWQLLRQMTQSFWNRWIREYLQTQLQRPKWTKGIPNPQVGDLVLYSPAGLPSSAVNQWPLGRVAQLLPGSDGVSRVLRITTPSGSVKRPSNKVVLLPRN